ncbi:hypothetical protein EW145_g4008 [Phellinidium pouzarii]|uniref:cAMP-independent regulatory protein pac2 n=1 Tax=Phellinidium pouzarii TaxID=167371 RepID=A0A4S4L6W4_9AGAM|nr:hypothetical protein EW145_g4008 [Phellinidium pouzarii]
MRPSQRPTATGIRVRSTRDANVLFHAVTCGILPMVSRRLDAADRAALRPGCVYVWEERSPASDATGAGMERFTEGRHWHPSRVRDVSGLISARFRRCCKVKFHPSYFPSLLRLADLQDFLLYVEKDWDTNEAQAADRNRMLRRHRESYPSTSYPVQPLRRQPLVKQTYSAWVNNGTNLKKWHMNAYYTEDSLEELRTVDEIPVLASLHVPHECYQRARSSTVGGSKKIERSPRDVYPGEIPRSRAPRRNSSASQSSLSDRDQQQALSPLSTHPRYAPFPPTHTSTAVSTSLPRLHAHSPSHVSLPRTADGLQMSFPPSFVPSQGPSVSDMYRSSINFPPPSPTPSAGSSSLLSPAGDEMADPRLLPIVSAVPGPVSHTPDTRSLVPLECLRGGHSILRREPADDEILRSFRPL